MTPNAEVNFLDLGMYTAGGGLPEGDYALTFNVLMFQATKQNGQTAGPPRLGVMITAHSLTDPAAEPRDQFYSMGSNADKVFAPNPDTGKGLVRIPGATGGTLNNSTNWAMLLKSLHDSGMPSGLASNDLSVLDGIHVHMTNVPEPQERAGFKSQTAEVTEERKAGTIAIVTEIKEDGKPWEGTGGIPEAAPAKAPVKAGIKAPAKVAPAAAKPGVKPPVKPAVKAPAKPVPAPAAEPEALDEETLAAYATDGLATVLGQNPNGVAKSSLRVNTLKYLTETYGEEVANSVVETYFADVASLNSIINGIGFNAAGIMVKPVA